MLSRSKCLNHAARALAIAGLAALTLGLPAFARDEAPSLRFSLDGRALAALALGTNHQPSAVGGPAAPATVVEFVEAAPVADGAKSQLGRDANTVIRGTHLSPRGDLLAVQVDMGPRPTAWLVDASDRSGQTTRPLAPGASGEFLAWHPSGRFALFKAVEIDVKDAGLWVVDTSNGSHRRLSTPEIGAAEGILAGAFSPDGSSVVWASSRGLGFGSQIWTSTLRGGQRRLLVDQPNGIVGALSYSPDGRTIAFNTLFDSPVPFAPAGVWVVEAQGRSKPRLLAEMDGGHGERPYWTKDSSALLYVARENPLDRRADHASEALVSSIRSVDLASGRETVRVPADGARQIDLAPGASGDWYFASNREGSLEIWRLDAAGALSQVTHDGTPKRYPTWVR